MSIPVAIPDLASALDDYEWAYLLTVNEDLRALTVAVSPTWSGDALVMEAGRRTQANAAARAAVTLCYPPREAGGYSLIVDGVAAVAPDASVISFAPSTAVLHRPAPPGFEESPTGCGDDCLPVTDPAAPS